MSIGRLASLVATVAGAIAACTAADPAEPIIRVNETTARVEGWFWAKGEWTLFPTADVENYDPYTQDENRKCLSLINGTGGPLSEYLALDGKNVVLTGSAVRYDTLSDGESPADRLLSKKYYNGSVVENACLRDLVFVVEAIGPAR